MKLLDILKKYVAPGILGSITIDSYRRQIQSQHQEMLNKEHSLEELNKMQKELWSEKLINQELNVRLEVCSTNIKNVDKDILDTKSKLEVISENLKTAPAAEGGALNKDQTVDNLTNWFNYYNNELTKLEELKNKHVNELQEIIDNAIKKSDLFDWVTDFIEKYQNFLNNISLDQKVALFNIICDIMILMALTSISILLIGNFIIKNYNLETKYPWLYKYIKIRENLNKYFLRYYIILLYIIVLLCLGGNIYMFVLKYFL